MQRKPPPYRDRQPFRTSAFMWQDAENATHVTFWMFVLDANKNTGCIKKYCMTTLPNGSTSTGHSSEVHNDPKRWTEKDAFKELCGLQDLHMEIYTVLSDQDMLLKPYANLHNFNIAATLEAVATVWEQRDPARVAEKATKSTTAMPVKKFRPK